MAVGALAHELFREVFALRKALAAIMDEVHARAGLRTPQRRAAGFLEREGPLPVPELARRLEVSRQFARDLCNEMAQAGLLAFTDNPRHRRSRLAGLTAAGRRRAARVRAREEALIQELLPGLDPGDLARALNLLRGLRRDAEAFAARPR